MSSPNTEPTGQREPHVMPERLPLSRAWLTIALDIAVVAIVAVVEGGPMVAGAPPWNIRPADTIDVARLVGISVPLLIRRRYPVPVLAMTIASFWGSDLLGFGLVVPLYSVGAHENRPWLSRAAGLAGVVAITSAFVIYRNVGLPVEALIPIAILGGAWLGGETMRLRRRYTAVVQQRALRFMELAKEDRDRMLAERARLEQERDERERRAAAAERARIARDLHDIVAHRVSMMTVQAGAARVVADKDPDAARRAIALLESAGRETLWELRRLVGLLREDADAEPLGPRPGLARLDELARDLTEAGVTVRTTVIGEIEDVPEAIQVSAYRIVQEALTNVLKHAGAGAEADVIVRSTSDALEVEVSDTGRGSPDGAQLPGGHGLIGMRERAAVFGGTVIAGPRREGGFTVKARLPTSQSS